MSTFTIVVCCLGPAPDIAEETLFEAVGDMFEMPLDDACVHRIDSSVFHRLVLEVEATDEEDARARLDGIVSQLGLQRIEDLNVVCQLA